MKPDICTSTLCNEAELGCDYCRDCSHAGFSGSAVMFTGALLEKQHMVTWTFEPHWGFTFKGWYFHEGQQPGEHHRIWKEVEKWSIARGLGLNFEGGCIDEINK